MAPGVVPLVVYQVMMGAPHVTLAVVEPFQSQLIDDCTDVTMIPTGSWYHALNFPADRVVAAATAGDVADCPSRSTAGVPTTGLYTFFTTSDDGSRLFIGDTLVVENNGVHGSQERSGVIGLQAGKHAFRVEYFEATGSATLAARYQGPGIAKQIIPNAALSYLPPCSADFDGSGGTPDAGDIDAFFDAWLFGDPAADADCSGGTPDTTDIDAFFVAWLAGGG